MYLDEKDMCDTDLIEKLVRSNSDSDSAIFSTKCL